ncbi:hypothetical protein Asulf_00742 [Archaeoglobus sulfaticallidus PM70-1]|uniref:Uncharacterized protein n=1 Tax=Archaeoglobus sulfaticallidus PM70-1 TaxID=387631 RepID=N0BKL8_9EURY|nr:hypothetical protein [Archaeoglobus sulfaticallidus]AGK60755.1 hypothetical protein Asulf_00742 [Archaeoglobus sulfaticallidus PM70-1]
MSTFCRFTNLVDITYLEDTCYDISIFDTLGCRYRSIKNKRIDMLTPEPGWRVQEEYILCSFNTGRIARDSKSEIDGWVMMF